MSQEHAFRAAELCLKAQTQALRLTRDERGLIRPFLICSRHPSPHDREQRGGSCEIPWQPAPATSRRPNPGIEFAEQTIEAGEEQANSAIG